MLYLDLLSDSTRNLRVHFNTNPLSPTEPYQQQRILTRVLMVALISPALFVHWVWGWLGKSITSHTEGQCPWENYFPLTTPKNILLVYQVTAVFQVMFPVVEKKIKQSIYSPCYSRSGFLTCKFDHETPLSSFPLSLEYSSKCLKALPASPLFSLLSHQSPLTLYAHPPWGT